MRRLKFVLLLSSILLGASTCEIDKIDPELPEITTEGKGILACTIDGENWEPCCTAFFQVDRNAYLTDKFVGIVGHRDKNSDQELHLQLLRDEVEVGKEKTFSWKDGNLGVFEENKEYGNNAFYYFYSKDSLGADVIGRPHELVFRDAYTLTIKMLRMDEEVVAGTFSFDALTHTGDTLRVRDGRFDLRVE
ncbi:hypothetical protein V6R21_30440 [Limibacter armeniacum]|uniref:hypothetical protein n=1 Tax=Limibacter armeniacum TaxID=466084 RepID=UPI002FE60619